MIKRLLKRIILSISIIYTLDVILAGFNILIPINIPTIIAGTVLGPLGITSLIIVKIVAGL